MRTRVGYFKMFLSVRARRAARAVDQEAMDAIMREMQIVVYERDRNPSKEAHDRAVVEITRLVGAAGIENFCRSVCR